MSNMHIMIFFTMHSVATDVLAYICSFILESNTICDLTRVNKRFKKIVYNDKLPHVPIYIESYEGFKTVTDVYKNITNIHFLTECIFKRIECFDLINPNITSLNIPNFSMTSEQIEVMCQKICKFRNLKELYLLCNVSVEFKCSLWQYFNKLEILFLERFPITDKIFENICKLVNLKILQVRDLDDNKNLKISVDTFKKIIKLQKLEELYFDNLLTLIPTALDYLIELPNLQTPHICYDSDHKLIISDKPKPKKTPITRGIYEDVYYDGISLKFDEINKLSDLEQLTHLSLHINIGDGLTDIRGVANLTNLKHLYLVVTSNTGYVNFSEEFNKLKQLTHFTFHVEYSITSHQDKIIINGLHNLENLTHISLQSYGHIDFSEGLHKLTNLVCLRFESYMPTGENLKSIFQSYNLEHLHLYGHDAIENHNYNDLDKSKIDNAIINICNLQKLKTLSIGNIPVSDRGFEYICQISSLISLCVDKGVKITDRGLGEIYKLKNLKWLKLPSYSNITYNGFKNIYTLSCLETLILGYSLKITNDDLKGIDKLVNLKKLRIGSEPMITDEGFCEIAKIKGVLVEILYGCESLIGDKGFLELCKSSNYTIIDISLCPNITKKGLSGLSNMKYLRKLIINMKLILKEGVVDLIRQFKNLASMIIIINYSRISTVYADYLDKTYNAFPIINQFEGTGINIVLTGTYYYQSAIKMLGFEDKNDLDFMCAWK